jgi:chromosome segregation ATPase
MKTVLDERFSLERGIAENEATVSLVQQLLEEASVLEPEIRKSASQFKLFRSENLREMLETSRQSLSKINGRVKENQAKMQSLEDAAEKANSQVLDNRVQLALLQYRRENVVADLKKIDESLKDAKASLDASTVKAEQSGARIAVLKNVAEILDEIRVTDGHLAALAGVSEDIERMYESYSKLYLELKEKAQVVAENREKTLREVKTRMQAWRNVMQSLLERVNLEYQRIMGQTLATGEVRLANGHDIETAGLEILVGFKGGKPVALDAYTQSGGERTTATMSFLLALQQHVRSPFRAVDEYDIHMDPKNREMIARMLLSTIKDATAQYIIITPSQITFVQEDVNIITVQNVEGASIVREVA